MKGLIYQQDGFRAVSSKWEKLRKEAFCSCPVKSLDKEKRIKGIKVVIALGIHLFPFRTEKLSPTTSMVLRKSGRVDSRRFRESADKINTRWWKPIQFWVGFFRITILQFVRVITGQSENRSVRKPCGYVMLKFESELSLRKIKNNGSPYIYWGTHKSLLT